MVDYQVKGAIRMKLPNEKLLMAEAAMLYYEKKYTQQEIAEVMALSRQTVSKLLNDAVRENVVEITIHHPEKECKELEEKLCASFGIDRCVVCGVSSKNESLRQLVAVKSAVDYLLPLLQKNGQKIALSWGRTVRALIEQLPEITTKETVVFPLFGATDNESPYFSSNELARWMADKLGAEVKYAWFPYLTDTAADSRIIKGLSYYKTMEQLWNTADVAIVGIGDADILEVCEKTVGRGQEHAPIVGDIATHFFDKNGEFVYPYDNSLCASAESIRKIGETVAIACGNKKAQAIACALRTNLLNTLITDEYTAKAVLEYA